LIREYENAKTAYNEIKAKFESAKIAKNIEVENKGERFVLIEAPLLPESPIKPNRKLIIIGGLVASILASVGLVILMDLMSKGVRGVDAIASVMGIQPIAAIPYIKSDAEEKRKIYMMYYVVFGVVSMVLIALLVIHFFVMPLDILMSKIVARF
jgi:capsular polysaccharide biosynthesis protein